MGIHPFQISDLNANFLISGVAGNSGAAYASEFALVADNINGSCSRYVRLQAVWADITIGQVSPYIDSFDQSTGVSNTLGSANPWRPNGGFFERNLAFANTATNNSGGGRNGYVGSFVGGLVYSDYTHDPNPGPAGGVDYEPVYGHGNITVGNPNSNWPMPATLAWEWLDSTNAPSDGSDQITTTGSVYARTPYMPPSYMIFHIDSSVSGETLGSGNVQFHMENRPTLRMSGFNDGAGYPQTYTSSFASASITGSTLSGSGYFSDPLRNYGQLSFSASQNFHEYYQVSGTRALNTRGLSFHLAKVMDNGPFAVAYPYEEDGITLGTGVVVTSNNIQPPYTYVNDQQEYSWAGGRDIATTVTSVISSGTQVTLTHTPLTAPGAVNFTPGETVLLTGFSSSNAGPLNGQLVVVAASPAPTPTQVTVNYVGSAFGATSDYGNVVYNPDFRIRNAATFIINEEYYGLVMDTKCTIWSNKSSMFPLVFFDLANTWTASVAKRIAGVAVVPTYINATQILAYQIFFLSEDGKTARYDFTQTNGVLELAGVGSFSFGNNAPAPAAAGEAYGALKTRSLTAPITATAVASNVLTVTCNNNFKAGDVVNITGTQESFLNFQTVTVLSAGLSTTQFTANYTTSNYTNASDTGSAVGYELWAVYGTMTADPRTTQTGLTNTARIGVLLYSIGTGAWTAAVYSPNTGRHNARNLSEMVSPRDGRLYILCEDVNVTAGFNVSNASGVVTNVNWQIMAYDPVAAAWNTAKINGSSPIQYGTNMGLNQRVGLYNYGSFWWFQNINAFMHDVGVGTLLIQGNWTAGVLYTLAVSGSTASLSNSNLTAVNTATILPATNPPYAPVNGFIPINYGGPGQYTQTDPSTDPFTILHARDYATNADRTVFFPNHLMVFESNNLPLFVAPPSFNWATASTNLEIVYANPNASTATTSFQKDYWSYSDLTAPNGGSTLYGWICPTQLTDNYMHFLRISAGTDGYSENLYGRSAGQSIGFLPTYYKWTGSAWTMADNWADAAANPYTIPAYAGGFTSTIGLPYGLAAQFGPTSGDSYSGGEFHTFNLCWGNTKYARKMRQSWAQFAGQSFTNIDTRTVASQNALSMNFIDTDLGVATWTAPTSTTPHTATLTTPYVGFNTGAIWNTFDAASPIPAAFDATATQVVWAPTAVHPQGNLAYQPAYNVTGSGTQGTPYTWTVGVNTYTCWSSSQNGTFPSWYAFSGSPSNFWQAASTPTQTITMGLPSPTTVLSYGFRPTWQAGTDGSFEYVPTTWQLWGSTTGVFGGEQVLLDSRSVPTPITRSVAYNVTTPGSYSYYQLVITGVTGFVPAITMFKLNTAVLSSTVNFVDLALYTFGTIGVSSNYIYEYVRNWQMSRGYKFEVSTNSGVSYTQIYPLWRSHNGYLFTFPAQTGVTNVRITCQHGYYVSNTQNGFGPFYLIDYGVSQSTLNAARLGNSLAPAGTAAAASFDPNCLGVATDVPDISIDGGNPSLLTAYSVYEDGAVHGFWDWNAVPANSFKMHPFYGFLMFEGAGMDSSFAQGAYNGGGTTAVINYQWGRRI